MVQTSILLDNESKNKLLILQTELMKEKGKFISNSFILREMIKFVLQHKGEFKKFLEGVENGNKNKN